MTNYLPYTGVGFEDIPDIESCILTEISYLLAQNGFTLRSGGYLGASASFEKGVNDAFKTSACTDRSFSMRGIGTVSPLKEIYMPYRGFNNHDDDSIYNYDEKHKERIRRFLATMRLDRSVSDADSPYVLRDCAVRLYQVLGFSLNSNSKFLICWTPDGVTEAKNVTRNTGPTGISIILADHFKMPVMNIGNETNMQQIQNRITQLKSGRSVKK